MWTTFPARCASVTSGATRMPQARLSMSPRALKRMVEFSRLHMHTPRGRRGACPRVDPGEIGLVALEETADGVHQHSIGGSGVETAGFFERQEPLHPPVAFVTGSP